ncbi:MAG: alpha/beta hydrolase, partial [Actinobacteria bacterium]|nr:alpha/beta hydrolase [Actinomycetota bacterium]
MNTNRSLAIMAATFSTLAWMGLAHPQERTRPVKDTPIEREKLSLAGWDPDEPVPALVYYKKGNKGMPVVIFSHGLGGNKEQYPDRMKELAGKGVFVVVIDGHLHGERKVPGIFPQG